MSGLYLIGVVAIWLFLTVSLWKGLRRWRNEAVERKKMRDMIALVVGVLWISTSFWYAGGRKLYYDWQVTRMCAVDGGTRVYETVKLPTGEYDRYAETNWAFAEKINVSPSDNYYVEISRRYLRSDSPKLVRRQARIIRLSDGNVLGEKVSYSRAGGDLPGPWYPSSFRCPEIGPDKVGLARSVFYKE